MQHDDFTEVIFNEFPQISRPCGKDVEASET